MFVHWLDCWYLTKKLKVFYVFKYFITHDFWYLRHSNDHIFTVITSKIPSFDGIENFLKLEMIFSIYILTNLIILMFHPILLIIRSIYLIKLDQLLPPVFIFCGPRERGGEEFWTWGKTWENWEGEGGLEINQFEKNN